MTSSTLTQITQLSVSERIQLVEDIWDTIAKEPDRFALTGSQQDELERRLQSFHDAPDAGSSWDAVKARVSGQ